MGSRLRNSMSDALQSKYNNRHPPRMHREGNPETSSRFFLASRISLPFYVSAIAALCFRFSCWTAVMTNPVHYHYTE